MNDDPDAMLRDSIIICALFWTTMLSLVFLSACTPTATINHEVPIADKLLDKVSQLKPPVTCRTLDLPPVPEDVKLDIFGDKITTNAGGEQLLRGYVACRSAYKAAP